MAWSVNTIMADPDQDAAPEGFLLVAVPQDAEVSKGWLWSEANGFSPPQ